MITTLRSEDGSTAQIVHYGAQVVSWIPAGHSEQLFLSNASPLDSGKPLRGGVPVIFPQFSDIGPLPRHGFARNSIWQKRNTEQGNQAVFELRDSATSRSIWPHAFHLELTVTLSPATLHVELTVHNTGAGAFEFTAALHTYLRVEQIDNVHVQGLKGTHYRDSVTGVADCVEQEDRVGISEQVDRVYLNAPPVLQVEQSTQCTEISTAGFIDAVVWNPWCELSDAMADMEADGYQRMLCVEAAVIGRPVALNPGAVWHGSQQLQFKG